MNKTCFVIAPININLDTLKEYFKNDFNISIEDITNVSSYLNIANEIIKKIKASDFVCAILIGDKLENVYIEIGITIGNDKPLFIITDNTSKIPEQLKNKVYAFSDSLDIEKIKYPFKVFYKKIIEKQSKKSQQGDRKEISSDLVLFYKSELELTHRIEQIFSTDPNISIEAMDNRIDKEARYDFTVWSDKLSESFGNPIIIELKITNSKKTLLKTINQLKNYLIRYSLNLGLIIYSGRKHEIKLDFEAPLIFIFEINELEKALNQNKSITDLIIKKRNEMVHSRGFRFG